MTTKKQNRIAVLKFTDYIDYTIPDEHISKSLKAVNRHNLGVDSPNIVDATGNLVENPKIKNHPKRKFNLNAHYTLRRSCQHKVKITIYNDGDHDIEICS